MPSTGAAPSRLTVEAGRLPWSPAPRWRERADVPARRHGGGAEPVARPRRGSQRRARGLRWAARVVAVRRSAFATALAIAGSGQRVGGGLRCVDRGRIGRGAPPSRPGRGRSGRVGKEPDRRPAGPKRAGRKRPLGLGHDLGGGFFGGGDSVRARSVSRSDCRGASAVSGVALRARRRRLPRARASAVGAIRSAARGVGLASRRAGRGRPRLAARAGAVSCQLPRPGGRRFGLRLGFGRRLPGACAGGGRSFDGEPGQSARPRWSAPRTRPWNRIVTPVTRKSGSGLSRSTASPNATRAGPRHAGRWDA